MEHNPLFKLKATPFFSKLSVRITAVFFFILCASFLVVSTFALSFVGATMKNSVADNTVLFAQQTINLIEKSVVGYTERAAFIASDERLKAALLTSNKTFDLLPDRDIFIAEADRTWTEAGSSSTTPLMEDVLHNEVSSILRSFVERMTSSSGRPIFGEVFVTNRYGVNIGQSGRTSDYFQADEPWWQAAAQQGLHIGTISYDESADIRSIDMAQAVYDDAGTFLGVVKAVFDVHEVEKIVQDLASSDTTSTKGRHIAHGHTSHETMLFTLFERSGDIITTTAPAGAATDFAIFGDNTEDGYIFVPSQVGTELLVVYVHGKILPWTLLVEEEVDEIVQPIAAFMNSFLLVIAGLAILVFFTILLSTHRLITYPLHQLIDVVHTMASGDFSARAHLTGRGEMNVLADAFNAMSSNLEALYGALEKKVEGKTRELSQTLVSMRQKTVELEDAQKAMVNLLEDLDREKKEVEAKVEQRTEDLAYEKDKLLQVTSNMRGGGILLNKDQQVVFVNDAARRFLSMDKNVVGFSEVLPHLWSLFPGEIFQHNLERCFRGETFTVPEIEGKERVFEMFFHCLKSDQRITSGFEGYFILFFDITDAKLLERSKSELVAVASHQLRTPLTAMRGNVEMLIDESYGSLNKDQHELLDDIEVSTVRLIGMVNDMLDITKIERGDIEMTLERIDGREIITSVVEDLADYARRHEFTIELHDSDVEPIVCADRVRVRQVFQNLIDNAIKYSKHPGRLDISWTLVASQVEFTLKDNGIGVPETEQSKLFGRFYRASNTTRASSSGSGLGLYIVRAIVQQLGGNIRLESKETEGTTFFVTLPVYSKNKSS